MKLKKKVLLEKTIQLHRVANDPEVKERINHELRDTDNYTHSFAFREFLRTLIKDLAYLHRIVDTMGEDIDGRVVLRALGDLLARGRGNYSSTSAKRTRYVTEAILAEFPDSPIPRLKLLRFLEMTAQQWIEDFFEVPRSDGGTTRLKGERLLTGLDDSPDELDGWVQNHRPIPLPPPFPVGAAEFLHQHRDQVRSVEETIRETSMPGRDDNLLKVLDELKNEDNEYDFLGKLKQDTRGNWTLGDLLIALETPADVEIYTTDRHYNVLCPALGKRLYDGYLPH